MYRILCYGDSNTWGYMPGSGERFAPDVRWTGVAQRLLGEDYTLLEEGMNGRTTVYDIPVSPGRNGSAYLLPCLVTHKPLDLAVLMLGTNDLRFTDAYGASLGARMLVRQMRLYSHIEAESPIFAGEPRILLVSPIQANPAVYCRPEDAAALWDYPKKSEGFAKAYEAVAKEFGLDFLDAARYAQASEIDGIHMDAKNHRALGEAMAHKIRAILEG